MKGSFFIFFVLVLLSSCGNGSQKQETIPEGMKAQALDLTGYSKRNIQLINQLGSISIYLPLAFDTFYTYADFGEYHCGETKQYRFASKKFGLGHDIEDSYSDPADSLCQLTIVQTYDRDCETNITIDSTLLNSMKKDKTHTYTMLDAKGKKIIAGVQEVQQDIMDVAVIDAITSVSGRQVKFHFQCYKKDAGNFVNQMLTSLKSLEVKEDGGQK
jgi:hypothetical protein